MKEACSTYVGCYARQVKSFMSEVENTVRYLLIQQNAAHDVERVMRVCAESGLSVLGLHENWVLLIVAGELDAISVLEEMACLLKAEKSSLGIQGEVMVKIKEGQVGAMSTEVAD